MSMNNEIVFLGRVYKLESNPLEGRYLIHLSLSQENYIPLAFILGTPWGHIATEWVKNGHISHMRGDVFCYACRQGKNIPDQRLTSYLVSIQTLTP